MYFNTGYDPKHDAPAKIDRKARSPIIGNSLGKSEDNISSKENPAEAADSEVTRSLGYRGDPDLTCIVLVEVCDSIGKKVDDPREYVVRDTAESGPNEGKYLAKAEGFTPLSITRIGPTNKPLDHRLEEDA